MKEANSNKTTPILLTIFMVCLIILCTVNPGPILSVYKLFYVKYIRITKSAFTSRFNDSELNLAIDNAKAQTWVRKQINSDLRPFKKGISGQQIEQIYSEFQHPEQNKLVLFTVADGMVSATAPENLQNTRGYKTTYDVIRILAQKNKIPDCKFIISLHDYLSYIPNTKAPVPIFTFAKHSKVIVEKDTILVPDWMNIRYWDVLRGRIACANVIYPWQRKIAAIHWRGGTTDSMKHRTKLLALRDKLKYLDVGMTEGENSLPFLDPEKSVKYKYQIALDGSRCTWERMIWQMSSNTVLLKPDSPQKQWFHLGLEPYKNYLPLKTIDEVSVISAYNWLQANDAKAKEISRSANYFAKNNFKTQDFFAYYAVLLQEYAKLYSEN